MAGVPAGLDAVTLDPGTTLLVTGPVMTGKRRLALDLLSRHAGAEDTVFVTTRKDAETIEREFAARAGDEAATRLSVVDCVGGTAGVRARDDGRRRYVSTPGDLTGIGIAVTGFLRERHARGERANLGLHSLSTMVMYADFRRVFQFLHVVVGRVSAADFRGVFTVDTSVVDDRQLDVLTQPFDARLDVRERGNEREFRVRGHDVGPRTWTALDGT